jgi:hypothetical protein
VLDWEPATGDYCVWEVVDDADDPLSGPLFSGSWNTIGEGHELDFARAGDADLDQIAGIPQRELLRVASSSQPLYIWVDAAGCRCYYVGGEEAYRRLEAMGTAATRN